MIFIKQIIKAMLSWIKSTQKKTHYRHSYSEENTLRVLYRHPILGAFIEYDMNTIKGKIKALSIMLNKGTPYIENMSDEELEDELSKLEDMYLESIGFNRKPNCI